MTRDPESRLPVLLMELLDESLTKMLEHSQQSLAYCVQVDICHDIALAVTYLHSNDIIHRDLSSNNVLMIAGRRAKVTDFGMSKLAGAAPSMTPLTMCPGTLAYMPPEALREPPRYTKKLDCFSEGVIMIQVCTRLWPEPGPRTQVVEDSRSPMGVIEMPVSETERRKKHIDLIDPNHALLPIAKYCIRFQEKDRPSSEELCQRLAGLKESREYRESAHQIHDKIQLNDDQVVVLMQQLQEKVQEKDRALQHKDNEIQERDRLLQQKERQLEEERASREKRFQKEKASQERRLRRLYQQLEEQEQVTAEIQQTNHSLQRQVEQLQQQLNQQSLKPPQPPPPSQAQVRGRQLQERESKKQLPVQPSLQIYHKPHPHRVRKLKMTKQLPVQPSLQIYHKPHPHRVRKLKMTLNWRDGGKAPLEMSRGAAVVDGDIAYFMSWDGDVCSYNVFSKKWSKLLQYPYWYSSLAVINGQLTAIGGCKEVGNKDTYTNKLLSLPGYEEIFPAMPTKRWGTTAVTSKEHLIVAGGTIGRSDADESNTVEVMDTKSLVWSTVASLPHPYRETSVTICGDQLYMLGGEDNEDKTKSVLTCSLTELLQSSSSSFIWHRVADAPAYSSTCAAVIGELLAIGGCDQDYEPSSAIHKYNPTTNSWDLISHMPTVRDNCLVTVLPTNEMMVVGGSTGFYDDDMDKIEIANFSWT
jgi:serine/threonine protein kinase